MSAIRAGKSHDGLSETGKCPEWQRELTVNQPPHGFEGSSPSFPTSNINDLDGTFDHPGNRFQGGARLGRGRGEFTPSDRNLFLLSDFNHVVQRFCL